MSLSPARKIMFKYEFLGLGKWGDVGVGGAGFKNERCESRVKR